MKESLVFSGSNIVVILDSLRHSTEELDRRVLRLTELVCDESICDEDVQAIQQLLSEHHCVIHLSKLELPRNGLTSKSGRSLASIVLLQHETLKCLSLAHNPFASIGLDEMLKPLVAHPATATNLIHLDLTNTQLGSKSGPLMKQLLRRCNSIQELNLTNNSLGPKGIKSLSVELKENSALKILNLSRNKIKAKGATLLAQAIGDPESASALKSLDLTCNAIGHLGMNALSRILAVNRTIESLYVGMNNIGPEGAANLAIAIKRNHTLQVLHIENNNIKSDAACLLFDQLRGDHNRTVENLNLAWNNIGTKGANHLAETLKSNGTLTSIDLTHNQIGSDDLLLLIDALSYNFSLTHLNVSSNQIDDRGAQAIFNVLCDPRPRALQSITCEDNPDISLAVLVSLSRVPQIRRNREHWLDKLITNLIGRKVHGINLKNRIVGNEELLLLNEALNDIEFRLKPPLIQSIRIRSSLLTHISLVPFFEPCKAPLLRIYLSDCCDAGEEGMKALATHLAFSKNLQVLSLTNCCITPTHAAWIAEGLRQNTTLRRLNLDDNQIGDNGLAEIALALPHKTLTSLSANGNNITDSAMGSKGLISIDELHLKNNHVTDRGALSLARNLLDSKCSLTWLNLKGNHVTEKGGATIEMFLPHTIPGTMIVEY